MGGDDFTWLDARELTIEGKGWPETERFFDRLPARAREKVRPEVWDLSRCSAGMAVRFVTDAALLRVRWRLVSEELARDHMPATAVSGLDLYVRRQGRYHWLSMPRPPAFEPVMETDLIGGIEPARREMMLYLPLLNGVESLHLGVPKGAALSPAPRRSDRPLLIYGTSIVHGGCASRAGMAYPAILGRKLDRPVLNLGFSGNGKAEPEVAELLAELDPAVYVIDPLPNLESEQVRGRIEPFVRILRSAHPATPIVLVESIPYADRLFKPARRERCQRSNAELAAAYRRLLEGGTQHLHYLDGTDLLGGDDEATVDGTHPTDLGSMRIAEAMEPVLRSLL